MAGTGSAAAGQRRRGAATASPQTPGGPPVAKPGQITKRAAKHINVMLCRAAEHGNPEDVLNVASSRCAGMSLVNLSTAIHKVARLGKECARPISPNDSRLKLLSSQIWAVLQAGAGSGDSQNDLPRCLATISWAYGTLQLQDQMVIQILELVSVLSQPQLHLFKPLELTNLLWGMARTPLAAAPIFQMSGHFIVARLKAFSTSNLSTLVWTFATARQVAPDILSQVVAEFGRRMQSSQMNPVEIANVLWGIATAKLHLSERILHEIGCQALALLPDFKLHELSITAWAFSRMGVRHDRLFAGIAKCLQGSPALRQQIHPQGIANLLWAFERQKALDCSIVPQLVLTLPSLLPVALQLMPELKPQEFTCVFQSLMRFGLTWRDCGEADDLFVAGSHAGGALVHRLSVPQRLDLLEAYASFLSGSDQMLGACASFVRLLVQACFEGGDGLELLGLHRVIAVACLATRMVSADLGRVVLGRVAQLALRAPRSGFPAAGLKQLLLMNGLPSDSDPASVRAALVRLAHSPADASSSPHRCGTKPSSKQTDASDEAHAKQGKGSYEDCSARRPRTGTGDRAPPAARPLALHAQAAACGAPCSATGPFVQPVPGSGSSDGHSPTSGHMQGQPACSPDVPGPFSNARSEEHAPEQPPPPPPPAAPGVLPPPPVLEEGSLDPLSVTRNYVVKKTFVELEEVYPRVCTARYFSEQPRPVAALYSSERSTAIPEHQDADEDQSSAEVLAILCNSQQSTLTPKHQTASGDHSRMKKLAVLYISERSTRTPEHQDANGDLSSTMTLASIYNSEPSTVTPKHQDVDGDRPKVVTLASLYNSERSTRTPEHGGANRDRSSVVTLASRYNSERSAVTPELQDVGRSRVVTLASLYNSERSTRTPEHQGVIGDSSRVMTLASLCNSERSTAIPDQQDALGLKDAGGDRSRVMTLATLLGSERNRIAPKHQAVSRYLSTLMKLAAPSDHQQSSTIPETQEHRQPSKVEAAAVHEATLSKFDLSAGLVSAPGVRTSSSSPQWSEVLPADTQRQADPQVTREPNGVGRDDLLGAPLGNCRALNTEQLLGEHPIDVAPEGCILSSWFGTMDVSPFVVKNTFLEFAGDGEANAARLCAPKFRSEQPRLVLRQ